MNRRVLVITLVLVFAFLVGVVLIDATETPPWVPVGWFVLVCFGAPAVLVAVGSTPRWRTERLRSRELVRRRLARRLEAAEERGESLVANPEAELVGREERPSRALRREASDLTSAVVRVLLWLFLLLFGAGLLLTTRDRGNVFSFGLCALFGAGGGMMLWQVARDLRYRRELQRRIEAREDAEVRATKERLQRAHGGDSP